MERENATESEFRYSCRNSKREFTVVKFEDCLTLFFSIDLLIYYQLYLQDADSSLRIEYWNEK